MKLYGVNLPELKPENAKAILQKCSDIPKKSIDYHKRNNERRRWDKYWVAAYDVVLKKLAL